MADSFAMTPVINNPVSLVSDMALSLERVRALLESGNRDLIENVAERLPETEEPARRAAFDIWCVNQIAIEKIAEIATLLGEAEGPLLAMRKNQEG